MAPTGPRRLGFFTRLLDQATAGERFRIERQPGGVRSARGLAGRLIYGRRVERRYGRRAVRVVLQTITSMEFVNMRAYVSTQTLPPMDRLRVHMATRIWFASSNLAEVPFCTSG
jgi:hypothetical protein